MAFVSEPETNHSWSQQSPEDFHLSTECEFRDEMAREDRQQYGPRFQNVEQTNVSKAAYEPKTIDSGWLHYGSVHEQSVNDSDILQMRGGLLSNVQSSHHTMTSERLPEAQTLSLLAVNKNPSDTSTSMPSNVAMQDNMKDECDDSLENVVSPKQIESSSSQKAVTMSNLTLLSKKKSSYTAPNNDNYQSFLNYVIQTATLTSTHNTMITVQKVLIDRNYQDRLIIILTTQGGFISNESSMRSSQASINMIDPFFVPSLRDRAFMKKSYNTWTSSSILNTPKNFIPSNTQSIDECDSYEENQCRMYSPDDEPSLGLETIGKYEQMSSISSLRTSKQSSSRVYKSQEDDKSTETSARTEYDLPITTKSQEARLLNKKYCHCLVGGPHTDGWCAAKIRKNIRNYSRNCNKPNN